MESLKLLINQLSAPQVMFPVILGTFFIIFPPTDGLQKINRALRINKLWTNKGGIAIFLGMFIFFAFGLTDPNFTLIVTKPDNVPIVALIFLTVFFLWFSLKQGQDNDVRIAVGEKPNEAEDAKEKVLVWPDLVYIEFIALILVSALLIVWSVALPAPLEEAANPTVSPNPSKAPWYFLGLQEMLVYFDPWLAGVVFPTVIMLGFMCIPFIDNNRKGCGYFTFNDRKLPFSFWLFFSLLWKLLVFVYSHSH